jgi:hypothetical protein
MTLFQDLILAVTQSSELVKGPLKFIFFNTNESENEYKLNMKI